MGLRFVSAGVCALLVFAALKVAGVDSGWRLWVLALLVVVSFAAGQLIAMLVAYQAERRRW